MSAIFSRTTRSLEADGAGRSRAGGLALVALLGAWAAWFFGGTVVVRELSQAARLEVDRAVHPVSVEVGGRVIATRLAIGREVAAGEVLVELDAEAERIALREAQARLADLRGRLESLHAEVAAERKALEAQRAARAVAVEEAAARAAEADARARVAERDAESHERASASFSTMLIEQKRAEAVAARAAARALALAAQRAERDRLAEEQARAAEIAELERTAAELRGGIATVEASVPRLEREVERRQIRAPVAGRIGEAAELRAGAVVAPGERLGSIVPPGELRAVAWFPLTAIGRVRPGQPGLLRLDGFPWTRFGAIRATVVHAATEPEGPGAGPPRAGLVRVELAVHLEPGSPIPAAHGLPGTADIEVERASPFALVLRAAGILRERAVAPAGRG